MQPLLATITFENSEIKGRKALVPRSKKNLPNVKFLMMNAYNVYQNNHKMGLDEKCLVDYSNSSTSLNHPTNHDQKTIPIA
jgi:hypothetical protein